MNVPKVFLSHASEDKPRFVDNFAQRLRADGVDAWLDTWEILPGDSFVDKIFEEGLNSLWLALAAMALGALLYFPIRARIKPGIPDVNPFEESFEEF